MLNRIATVLMTISLMVFTLNASIGARAGELIEPDPSISPQDVISIQLTALMNNDQPEKDFGISQTWAFAHPDNRVQTGPLNQFAMMMKGPYYRDMINHSSHTVTEMNRARDWVQFKVMMEDSKVQVLAFYWVVKKVQVEPFADCWMTSAVSPPVPAGRGS